MGIEVSITGSGNTAVAIPGPAYEQYSQSFPSGSGFDLQSVSIKLALGIGAPGNVVCNIYAVDGSDLPIGLTKGTVTISAASLNTYPTWGFKLFTFDPVVVLSPATQYCFVISTDAGSWDVNYIYIGTNGGDTYGSGVLGRYDGSWSDANNTYPATIRSPSFIVYDEGTKTVTATAIVDYITGPGKAWNPGPTDDQEDVAIIGRTRINTLTWNTPTNETPDFLVYYRAEGGAWVLQETITDDSTLHTLSSAIRSAISYYSIYEWRVDTREAGLTTTGDTWTFITQQEGQYTDYTRRSDYDADKVWQPGAGWVDINSFEFTGGGRYKGRVLVVGHQVIYFGDL